MDLWAASAIAPPDLGGSFLGWLPHCRAVPPAAQCCCGSRKRPPHESGSRTSLIDCLPYACLCCGGRSAGEPLVQGGELILVLLDSPLGQVPLGPRGGDLTLDLLHGVGATMQDRDHANRSDATKAQQDSIDRIAECRDSWYGSNIVCKNFSIIIFKFDSSLTEPCLTSIYTCEAAVVY